MYFLSLILLFLGYVAQNDEWKCGVGDRMGCGVVIDDKKLSTRLPDETPVYIYATKNEKVIHVQGDIIPEAGYYPTISLFEKGINLHTKSIFASIFYFSCISERLGIWRVVPLDCSSFDSTNALKIIIFFWDLIHVMQDEC